ncbi:MAG: enoyl-CoA hydratase/isomerase family protein [Ignavibacteriales bacterium]|nr:enoyl-CoA hydratase/isomerase family protein [Ignavibacteriales bacterium]
MSEFQFLKIIDEGEVVSLVFNRPPLNVLNIAMMKEINSALSELLHHTTAKVLLIKAEGKAFSAGVDVADHVAEKIDEMMREFHHVFENINKFKIPVIAVVDGAALGGGCEVVIFCDMILASEKAKFGQPEIKVGVFPPIAAVIFPRLIGRNRTLEWLMNGETISAVEAEKIGLVNKVFPVENFETHVKNFVAKFTAQSKVILEMTKRAVDTSLRRPVMEAISNAEEIYMKEMMKTEDANEGLSAFLEKRNPVWKNK